MGNKDYCITDFKNFSIQINFKITEIHTQKRYFPVAYVRKMQLYNLKKSSLYTKRKRCIPFFPYLLLIWIIRKFLKLSIKCQGPLSHVHTPDISWGCAGNFIQYIPLSACTGLDSVYVHECRRAHVDLLNRFSGRCTWFAVSVVHIDRQPSLM